MATRYSFSSCPIVISMEISFNLFFLLQPSDQRICLSILLHVVIHPYKYNLWIKEMSSVLFKYLHSCWLSKRVSFLTQLPTQWSLIAALPSLCSLRGGRSADPQKRRMNLHGGVRSCQRLGVSDWKSPVFPSQCIRYFPQQACCVEPEHSKQHHSFLLPCISTSALALSLQPGGHMLSLTSNLTPNTVRRLPGNRCD